MLHVGERPPSTNQISRWLAATPTGTLTVVAWSLTTLSAIGWPQSARSVGAVAPPLAKTYSWKGAVVTSNDSVPVAASARLTSRPTPALPK